MFYIEGGDGNFISYGRTHTHTDRQTHRSTYRGGAHLKMNRRVTNKKTAEP